MKIQLKKLNLAIFIGFSLVIFLTMIYLEPQRYGDGNEYFLMLESLSNHLSPDLRLSDIENFYTGPFNAFGQKIDPYSGYFKANNGSFYSYHFWAYSLFSVPAKNVLTLLQMDSRKALQLTNAFLFILLLAVINFYSNFNEKQKLILMLLTSFSPILWFIHWTHAEIFIITFISLSLIFLKKGNYSASIVSASIASFQNQSLIFFAMFLWITACYKEQKIKSFIKYSLMASLIFLPNIFYFIHFKKFSLLSYAVSSSNISISRIFEIFFDLNIGLFPYITFSLLLFFCIIFLKTYREKKVTSELLILIVMIAMAAIFSATYNWNHGTSGPSRYALILMPFIFFTIADNLKIILGFKVLKLFLLTAIIVQTIIVILGGGFVPTNNYVQHSIPAVLVLNNFPSLYNPTFEIFCERTMGYEIDCINPIAYVHNNKCKKALLTCEGIDTLQSICGSVPDKKARDGCNGGRDPGGWFYINYEN